MRHLSYEPPPSEPGSPNLDLSRSGSVNSRRASSFCTSTVTASLVGSSALSSSETSSKNPSVHLLPEFYAYFMSGVWITHLSHFHPIKDASLTVLEREQAEATAAAAAVVQPPISSSPLSKCWQPGGERGSTRGVGWGCMLRTGQSLRTTALVHRHPGQGS